ncbi:MAG: hypothetical protein HS115_10490 [Spirochaetales bacterium]|nr:hypothetical protein [Spirochaetales bacterium]
MRSFASILLILVLAACIPPGGAGGIIYNNYSAPYIVTANRATQKVAEANVRCFVGLICTGDASVSKIAEEAGIQKVASVDYRYTSILLFLFTRTTIVVKGE